jgi:hypothetical protein
MWAELLGWSKHYDPERAARELGDDDWELFLDVVAETNAFVEAVTQERHRHPSAEHLPDQSEA